MHRLTSCIPKVLLVGSVPACRDRFLAYGSRASTTGDGRSRAVENTGQHDTKDHQDQGGVSISTREASDIEGQSDRVLWILDRLAAYRVPHNWFTHFYVLSVTSSLFWAYQILYHERFFAVIARLSDVSSASSMSVEQVFLVWSLMLIQGIRRLYECLTLTRSSNSEMWFLHWLLGLAFYAAMGVAVWVEGLRTCFSLWQILNTAEVENYLRTSVGHMLRGSSSVLQHRSVLLLLQISITCNLSSFVVDIKADFYGQPLYSGNLPTLPHGPFRPLARCVALLLSLSHPPYSTKRMCTSHVCLSVPVTLCPLTPYFGISCARTIQLSV